MHREIEGKYFGTEVNKKWWKRYTKNNMLARGNGILSYNEQSIFFIRQLTKAPIAIDFSEIVEFKTGDWHAGQWSAGRKIIKVIWKKDNKTLSSGFTVLRNSAEITDMISNLNEILETNKK